MWFPWLFGFAFLYLNASGELDLRTMVLRFYDSNDNLTSYGSMVSENFALVYDSPFENSNKLAKYTYLNYRGDDYAALPEGSFEKFDNKFYLFKANFSAFPTDRVARINRYPSLGYFEKLLSKNTENGDIEIQLLSDTKCQIAFPAYNPDKQVCAYQDIQSKFPLFGTVNGITYIIGFQHKDSNGNKTLFDLIAKKNSNLPTFAKLDMVKTNSSLYTIQNSVELCDSLKESSHPEIIVVGNVEIGNNNSFIPLGFGTVVSKNHLLVSSDIIDSLKNYEIYGDGKELKVAFMLNNKVIHEQNYTIVTSTEKYKNEKTLQLLKFNDPDFKDIKDKAEFIFDSNFEAKNKKFNRDNVTTFKFVDEKLLLQKITEVKDEKKIATINPLFFNDKIIGFKEGESVVSAFKFLKFLKDNVDGLKHKIITTTTTPKTTSNPTTSPDTVPKGTTKVTVNLQEIPPTPPTTELQSSTTEPEYEALSDSSNKLALTLWPLFLAFFPFLLLL